MRINGAAFDAAPLNGAQYQRIIAASAALASNVVVTDTGTDGQRALVAIASAVDVEATAFVTQAAAAQLQSAVSVTAQQTLDQGAAAAAQSAVSVATAPIAIFAGASNVVGSPTVYVDSTLQQAAAADLETDVELVAFILHYVQANVDFASAAQVTALAGASLGRADLASAIEVDAVGTQTQLAQGGGMSGVDVEIDVAGVWVTRGVAADLEACAAMQADAGINGIYSGFAALVSAVEIDLGSVNVTHLDVDIETNASVSAIASQAYAAAATIASAVELDDGAVRYAYFTAVLQTGVDVEASAIRITNGAATLASAVAVSPAAVLKMGAYAAPVSAVSVRVVATLNQQASATLASAVDLGAPVGVPLRRGAAALGSAVTITALGALDAERKDPPERTMERPFNDRVMFRPFNDRVMYHPPSE